MSLFGIAVTNITSKFGLLSRKASMRLATETGKKLFDKSQQLGRTLNKSEIENTFNEVLPKKCRPKILTNKNDCVPYFKEIGFSEQQAKLKLDKVGGVSVPNINGKRLVYVPIDKYDNVSIASITAHELEHTLEANHRPQNLIHKIIDQIKMKRIKPEEQRKYIRIASCGETMQDTIKDKFGVIGVPGKTIDYGATASDISKQQGYKSEQGLFSQIRKILRNRLNLNPKTKGYNTIPKYNVIDYTLDMEKPAYTVQGKVEEYALNLTDKNKSEASVIVSLYDTAKKVVKQEKKRYLKNKILGRLKSNERLLTGKDKLEAQYMFGLISKEQYEIALKQLK